jgi:hypothetical protein
VSEENPLNNIDSRYSRIISEHREMIASARAFRDWLRDLLSLDLDNLEPHQSKLDKHGPWDFQSPVNPSDVELQTTICVFLLNDYSLRVSCLQHTLSRLVDGAVFHSLGGFSLPSPWCISVISESLDHPGSKNVWRIMRKKMDINPTSSDVLLLSQFPDSFFARDPSGTDSILETTTGTVYPLLDQWRSLFLQPSAPEDQRPDWWAPAKKVGSAIWNLFSRTGSQGNPGADQSSVTSWDIPWREEPELVDQLFEMPALRGVRRRYGRSFAVQSGSVLQEGLGLPAFRKESGNVPAGFIAMVCEHLDKLLRQIREQDLEFPEKRKVTEEKFMELVSELEVTTSGPSELSQLEVRSQIKEWLDGLKQQWDYQPEYLGLDPDSDSGGIGRLARGLD